MITPVIMLVLMVAPCVAVLVASAITRREHDLRSAGAIGLGLLFIFTGLGHFVQTESMAQMLPPWVPVRELIVHLTGALEFAVAAGFLIPRLRRYAGWAAAIMLVLFFPANVYAAFNHAPMGGHAWGPAYLFVRAPLQLAVLLWVYGFAIRQPKSLRWPKRRAAADPSG